MAIERIKSWWGSIRNKFYGEYQPEQQAEQPEQADQQAENTWTKEVMSTVCTTLLEGVKVAMATLLSIFVPQYCEETGTTCTLKENFSNLSTFNEAVIVWNFITLGLFCALSYVQTKRETYFISHLDENLEQPYNSFMKNCRSYPKIVHRVKQHNDNLYLWSYLVVVAFTVNIIISSILVFHYFYDGFRTATTLLANVLLVSNKLYSYWDVCIKCRQSRMLALSTVKMIPASFNCIDGEYKAPGSRKREYNASKLKATMTLKAKRRLIQSKQKPVLRRHSTLSSIKVETVDEQPSKLDSLRAFLRSLPLDKVPVDQSIKDKIQSVKEQVEL